MIENGVIRSTSLGVEDHGILSAMIDINFGGSGQGFGGWTLDDKPLDKYGSREGTAWGMEYINLLLKTVGVDSWEKLPGTPIRVRRDENRGKIVAIGHFIENKWFEPEKDLVHLLVGRTSDG